MDGRTYNRDGIAGFRFTKARFGAFSNMHPGYPIRVPTGHGMIRLDSTETLYQMAKFPHAPEIQREIMEAGGPKPGKTVAWAHGAHAREDWAMGASVEIMKYAIRMRLAQHRAAMLAEYEDTMSLPIVEISRRDSFWGAIEQPDGTYHGRNILGRLHMQLREELRVDPEKFRDEVPAPRNPLSLLGSRVVDWRETRTLNAHVHGKNLPGAVYVGRPGVFGNPCSVEASGSREAAIKGYLDHLRRNPDLVNMIRRELVCKDVICWCAPRACHGDVIRHIAAGGDVPERWPHEPEPLSNTVDHQTSFDL